MYTSDGWLTAKAVKVFFVVIVCMAILGALSSCNQDNEVYYLQVNDYNEETVCVNIVDSYDNIIMVLDTNVDVHSNPQQIVESINNGQIGYHTVDSAIDSYRQIVK